MDDLELWRSLKRGVTFIHKRWLDNNFKPLRCKVTRIAQGTVYWRSEDDSSPMHFPLTDAEKYVAEIVEGR